MSENAPDEFHAHEALHVTHLLQNIVAGELEDHPFVEAYPDVAKLVGRVQDALGALYQAIGSHRFPDEEPTK